MKYHPDKNPDAGDKFKEIRFAQTFFFLWGDSCHFLITG